MIGGVKLSEMNLPPGRFISHGAVYQALGAISSALADRRCGLSAPPIGTAKLRAICIASLQDFYGKSLSFFTSASADCYFP
jgi:hypothetical protein